MSDVASGGSDHDASSSVRGHRCRRRPRTQTSSNDSNNIDSNRNNNNNNKPPGMILDEILDLLATRTGTLVEKANANDCKSNTTCWSLEAVSEAQSAQQEVYILKFTDHNINNNDNDSNNNISERSDAIDCNRNQNGNQNGNRNGNQNEWSDAMRLGKNRLVLRIWKGGSRWWNLNRNENILELATSEIHGYQVAREAFETFRFRSERYPGNERGRNRCNHASTAVVTAKQRKQGAASTTTREQTAIRWRMGPTIPRVLHFHLPPLLAADPQPCHSDASQFSESLCWAVLEYVGADENDCLAVIDDGGESESESRNNNNSNNNGAKVDRSYLEGMVKVRSEFGFEEPHPRWGRVPVESSLDYARLILKEVILPLHRYSNRNSNNHRHRYRHRHRHHHRYTQAERPKKTFSGMTKLYRQAWKDATSRLQHHNQITIDGGGKGRDDRFELCLQRLDKGIRLLQGIIANNETTTSIPPLDPVLLHLDLQPQNLIFYQSSSEADIVAGTIPSPSSSVDDQDESSHPRNQSQNYPRHDVTVVRNDDDDDANDDDDDKNNSSNSCKPSVFSVLDWEDAAWGDPRFDLVLLCRKVCANRDQANALWSEYAKEIAAQVADDSLECSRERDGEEDSSKQTMPYSKAQQKQPQQPAPIDSQPERLLFLGPIEPWLQLETVHSIATMLLQSMDLANGGRNPWETKMDLWGKLQREFMRLHRYETCE